MPVYLPNFIIFAANTILMSIIDFIETFPVEASCKQKFKEYRDQV